mgnify:CR=1 FL=1
MAIGIYGQYIYIDPHQDLIIVKNSANHSYTQRQHMWTPKHLGLFRAISDQLQAHLVKIEP